MPSTTAGYLTLPPGTSPKIELVFPSYAVAASLVTVPWMFFGELS
jgi:hypothetical protein